MPCLQNKASQKLQVISTVGGSPKNYKPKLTPASTVSFAPPAFARDITPSPPTPQPVQLARWPWRAWSPFLTSPNEARLARSCQSGTSTLAPCSSRSPRNRLMRLRTTARGSFSRPMMCQGCPGSPATQRLSTRAKVSTRTRTRQLCT